MASTVHDYKYSVQVRSRFDLLADEELNAEDPEIYLDKLRSRKRERKSSGPSAKEASVSKATGPSVDGDHKVSEQTKQEQNGAQRNGPRGAEGAAAPRGEHWEGRGRGGRQRGGFSRSRPGKSGGQREFDRHSGSDKTGVKAVVKKDGHGTGNWGTIEDELEAQMADTTLEVPAEEETPVAEVKAAEPEQVPAEEEPKTITLQEYRKKLNASKSKVQLTTKGSRPPNDGENVFSNMVEVHKSKPVEQKVEVLLEDKTTEEEAKPVFFEFGRGRPPLRGRGPRPSGSGETRGRGGVARQVERVQEPAETTEAADPPPDIPVRGGRGRGMGVFRGRRGARAPFNPDRRGGRGRGGGADRPFFRGGERGGRGPRGGPRGAMRRGRGSFEPSEGERRPTGSRPAPSMDSDADFPALK
ncbi:unnamed protein product [Mesocestoides corti]|uniref:HABP4_PAI-RBP1 domain-containing protein n=1 Tax=Mesocestoides corti TaxID=53468 RepID=A0A0R3U1Y0_MESCO|nr:unnamed protein product [Mesocestoides corti]